MNIFLDTNIILEYFCQRQGYKEVEQIMISAEDKEHCYVISLGSFYTITYLIDYDFKKKGLNSDERHKALKETLTIVLDLFNVYGLNVEQLSEAINDDHFMDLEDSYQYQVAKATKCEAIVTINLKDFKNINDIEILSPYKFISKYKSK